MGPRSAAIHNFDAAQRAVGDVRLAAAGVDAHCDIASSAGVNVAGAVADNNLGIEGDHTDIEASSVGEHIVVDGDLIGTARDVRVIVDNNRTATLGALDIVLGVGPSGGVVGANESRVCDVANIGECIVRHIEAASCARRSANVHSVVSRRIIAHNIAEVAALVRHIRVLMVAAAASALSESESLVNESAAGEGDVPSVEGAIRIETTVEDTVSALLSNKVAAVSSCNVGANTVSAVEHGIQNIVRAVLSASDVNVGRANDVGAVEEENTALAINLLNDHGGDDGIANVNEAVLITSDEVEGVQRRGQKMERRGIVANAAVNVAVLVLIAVGVRDLEILLLAVEDVALTAVAQTLARPVASSDEHYIHVSHNNVGDGVEIRVASREPEIVVGRTVVEIDNILDVRRNINVPNEEQKVFVDAAALGKVIRNVRAGEMRQEGRHIPIVRASSDDKTGTANIFGVPADCASGAVEIPNILQNSIVGDGHNTVG